MLSHKEQQLLIELICNEQTHMIRKDHTRYGTNEYQELEKLKLKVKEMKLENEEA